MCVGLPSRLLACGERESACRCRWPPKVTPLPPPPSQYEILNALKPLHEAFAKKALEPTSVYGVRVYGNGSTLVDHLDVCETHVVSSILHIGSKLDAPFPIEIEDMHGETHAVSLEPGDLFFYESAKSFHKRSVPMVGDHYASIFMHYRPVGWEWTRSDAQNAIPPHWSAGLGGAG